jgi:hypothetical protein
MATNFNFAREISAVNAIGAERNVALTRELALVQVRDNTKFVEKFDASKVIGVYRPTRTLVVGQTPAAGSFIPVGTPVDLIVTVKETLPLGGLKDIDSRVFQRFQNKNIGDVLNTLANTDAKRVIDRPDAPDYDALSTADKAVVNAYITTTYDFNAAADPAGAKSIYSTVKFLNDL